MFRLITVTLMICMVLGLLRAPAPAFAQTPPSTDEAVLYEQGIKYMEAGQFQ